MGHLQISSCLLGFCQQQVLPRGATEQLSAGGCGWHHAAFILRTWCHTAALQAEMGHPEVLLDLRFSLFLTSTHLLLHSLCPGSSCLQPEPPEHPRAPGSGRADPDLEGTPLALPGHFTAVIFLPVTSTVGVHTLSKIHSLHPPRAAFLLAPATLVLLGEPELHLKNICGKLEPG